MRPLVFDGTGYTIPLHPLACSVHQSLKPLSTVVLQLPDYDEIGQSAWARVDTPDGETGYYRATSVTTDGETGNKEVYLEHGACTLGDTILTDTSVRKDTIPNLVSYILTGQSRWTAGTIQATRTVYVDTRNKTRLEALSALMRSIPEYDMLFVQSSASDWHIDIRLRPVTAVCEARISRNMKSCEIAYDAQNIVTRVYCEGLTGGKMDSANISEYGLREEVQSLNDSLTAAQKTEIVAAYLANHDHPQISISVDGVELSQTTGLSIDRFLVGTVCRVAIPWMSVAENEVIISKDYPDVCGTPEKAQITLANAMPDLSLTVAAMKKGSSAASQAADDADKAKQTANEANERAKLVTTKNQSGDYEVSASSLVNAINGQDTSGMLTTAKIQVGSGSSAETLTKTLSNIEGSLTGLSGDMTTLENDVKGLDTTVGGAVTGFGTAVESSGQITIPFYTVGSPSPTAAGNITFDIAATQAYLDGVAAARQAGVQSVGLVKQAPSGSTLQNQVTVSTSSSTKTMTVTAGLETSGTITVGQQQFELGYEASSHKYLLAGTAMIGGGSPVSYSTGRTGTEAYDDGYDDGYDTGHDSVTGSEIDLNGSSAATSATQPTTNVIKANGAFSGYVWLQLADGTWKNLRSFSLSMPSTATWSHSYQSQNLMTVYCTVAGKRYSTTISL